VLLPILAPHTKKRKKKKNQKTIVGRKQKNIYSNEQGTQGYPENDQRLVEKVQKYKDWNLTVYFWLMKALLTKKI